MLIRFHHIPTHKGSNAFHQPLICSDLSRPGPLCSLWQGHHDSALLGGFEWFRQEPWTATWSVWQIQCCHHRSMQVGLAQWAHLEEAGNTNKRIPKWQCQLTSLLSVQWDDPPGLMLSPGPTQIQSTAGIQRPWILLSLPENQAPRTAGHLFLHHPVQQTLEHASKAVQWHQSTCANLALVLVCVYLCSVHMYGSLFSGCKGQVAG